MHAFTEAHAPSLQWHLVAHPQGSDGRGRYLSLYLTAQSSAAHTPFSGWRRRIAFTLAVAGHEGQLAARVSERCRCRQLRHMMAKAAGH